MKAHFGRQELVSAYKAIGCVIPTRSPNSILMHALLSADNLVTLAGTDLERSARAQMPGVTQVPGSALLPLSVFDRLEALQGDEVMIETSEEAAVLTCGSATLTVPTMPAEEFPELDFGAFPTQFTIESADLLQMIGAVKFAADENASRYALGGACFDCKEKELTLVATDGRQLAATARSIKASGEFAEVVPLKALELITRALKEKPGTVKISHQPLGSEGEISVPALVRIHGNGITLSLRAIEGKFPRWREAFSLENCTGSAEVAVKDLKEGIKFTKIKEQPKMLLDLNSEGITLSRTFEGQSVSFKIPATIKSAGTKFAVDSGMLSDYLRTVRSSHVTFSFGKQEEALIFVPSEGPNPKTLSPAGVQQTYVLMPCTLD